MSELITPFKLTVADEMLADLRSRLAQTRWPDRETVSDRSQGAPLDQSKRSATVGLVTMIGDAARRG
jgi:hypothetical protein